MSNNAYLRIIRKTGRKPVQCKCQDCQKQCRTPCLGTPDDILRLIEAGYVDKLAATAWAVAMVHGLSDRPILMFQATQTPDGCVFFHNGLCELHDLGLKPTEGKLSHHRITKENYKLSKGLAWNVAHEWERDENVEVIIKIIVLMAKHSERCG